MPHTTKQHYHLYCGIDIGKSTCEVAVLPIKGAVIQPFTICNEEAGFNMIRHKLEGSGIQPSDILVILEPTSTLWMPVARFLYRAGYDLVAINPLTARRHINALLERNKTDRIDALRLAEIGLLARQQLTCWEEPPLIYEELRQRMELRDALVDIHAKQLNRQHAVIGRRGILIRSHIDCCELRRYSGRDNSHNTFLKQGGFSPYQEG